MDLIKESPPLIEEGRRGHRFYATEGPLSTEDPPGSLPFQRKTYSRTQRRSLPTRVRVRFRVRVWVEVRVMRDEKRREDKRREKKRREEKRRGD